MTKYRSDKLSQKKRKRLWINTAISVVAVTSSFFAISELTKLEFLQIKKVEVTGNNFIENSVLREIVESEIAGNYFGPFFSKGNILTYSKRDIENKLFEKYARLKEVDIDLDFPGNLFVNVLERGEYAVWCENENNCFFVDEGGYIFDGMKGAGESNLFKYYLDMPSEQVLRQKILDGKFEQIDSFVSFAKGIGLKPYELRKDENGNYELYFGEGTKVIFDSNVDTKVLTENLQAILNMDEFVDKENLFALDYLDLRFGNKVFYK